MAGNWANFPEVLLENITDRLASLADRLCVASVCRSWRYALGADDRPRTYLPFLVLPDQEEEGRIGRFCLVDLSDQKVRRGLKLPLELSGWSAFGASHSWLGMMNDLDASARLLDPFTGDVIVLPPVVDVRRSARLSSREPWFPVKLCLSSPEPGVDPGCVAVVIRGHTRSLAYALPGCDGPWMALDQQDIDGYDDVLYYKGTFYAISRDGVVVAADVITGSGSRDGHRDVPRLSHLRTAAELMNWRADGRLLLAVHPDGDLVVVSMKEDNRSHAMGHLQVTQVGKIDMKRAVVEVMGDLGDCALFLGSSSCVSIRASQVKGGGCRESSIYFANDCRVPYRASSTGHLVQVFVWSNGGSGWLYGSRKGSSFLNPPMWIAPRPWPGRPLRGYTLVASA
ncbi:hypothetical protein Taro_024988 [Colocasia esculenta]|uniref:KIB1-4 beta-propeller domain-containing protein n=1 Tax=Colocasia esculenta TaxID=4460 RepID=A0A843VM02_COLES|nr:hypothetical protein [Colocasia esculenta]